jgi:phosphoribosyl-dephospho-CoA transferase
MLSAALAVLCSKNPDELARNLFRRRTSRLSRRKCLLNECRDDEKRCGSSNAAVIAPLLEAARF